MVVNYFSRSTSSAAHSLLVATTELALHLLSMNAAVHETVLVDGSATADDGLADRCEQLGVSYRHAGRELSYVEAYNIGWRCLDVPYIGLMANDIIPHPLETMQALLDWIARPDVGCAFPYLTSNRLQGGDEVQRVGYSRRGALTCEPSSMTLNLNLFKRSVLEQIGGLDENYRFGFAEPILLIKLRNLGYRAVMVGGTRAFHYDQLTKGLGQSSLGSAQKASDRDRWYAEYPDYASPHGLADIACWRWPFATTRTLRILWSLVGCVPVGAVRDRLRDGVMWAEPRLSRYPARGGRMEIATS